MKFPFIFRYDHEEQVRLLNLIISDQDQAIRDISLMLGEKDNQIKALVEQLSQPRKAAKPPTGTEAAPKVHKSTPPTGSWRAIATARSRRSMPDPKDSAKSLENKVIREGGVV